MGTRTEQPKIDAHYMFLITDLIPKGNTLQLTHLVKYKTRRKRRRPDTFKQYIKDLPVWERQLFSHWKHITDDKELKTHILLCKIFYYVTDGDADNGIGYFGWLIATETKIITKGYCQALGIEHQMESFRAQTYGGIA
eukprot:304459-Ditylum_brightwellii.AAC.1